MNLIWNIIKAIAHFFLNILFKIMGKELTDEIFENFMQFIKFGLVGVSNTIVAYAIYTVSLILIKNTGKQISFDYIIAQTLGFVLSVPWSFFWNSKFVFKLEEGEKRPWFPALIKTYISYSFTGIFLNNVLLILWVKVFGISEFIAPIINIFVNVPINFIINKLWAFRAKKSIGFGRVIQ
ncbi:MAG: GtrA family protein [Lachnospiraceae bacterium]|nr:GtrA family protein [Lachnospiraceae bacterium]